MASVVEHLAFQGLSSEASRFSADIEGKNIHLPTIGVMLSIGVVHEPTKANVLGIEVIAEREGLPTPISFTSVGFGDNLEAASHSAAKQWFQVVFPVLHALYADHATSDVDIAKISARNRSTGQRFKWRVILGPIRVVSGQTPEPVPAPGGEIMEALKHEITGIAASSEQFWINAFVAVHGDGTPIADCRLVNEPWPEATERLGDAATNLLGHTGDFHSWRQFMFFDPLAVDEDSVFDPEKSRQSWWKKLRPSPRR